MIHQMASTGQQALFQGSARGALGIYAKSQAKPEKDLSLLRKFATQSAARRILGPEFRTSLCMRAKSFQRCPEIWRENEGGACHFKGLQTCGSVWSCPVCSAKVSEVRRAELRAASEQHRAHGGHLMMWTFTTPHSEADDLSWLVRSQTAALVKFWAHRSVKDLLAESGVIGKVRAFEVTHGRKRQVSNGWHPHFHYLIFIKAGAVIDLPSLEESLFDVWRKVCKKAGLKAPSSTHGLKVDNGQKAAEYVAKWGHEQQWGMHSEMTKSMIKTGKDKGETPFDLLRAFFDDPTDKQAAALFREYSSVFRGKRQLTWSPGLKASFDLEELSDEDIASGGDAVSVLLGSLSDDQWRDVLHVDARGQLLHIAEASGWSGVELFCHVLSGVRDPLFVRFSASELDELVSYAKQASPLTLDS